MLAVNYSGSNPKGNPRFIEFHTNDDIVSEEISSINILKIEDYDSFSTLLKKAILPCIFMLDKNALFFVDIGSDIVIISYDNYKEQNDSVIACKIAKMPEIVSIRFSRDH